MDVLNQNLREAQEALNAAQNAYDVANNALAGQQQVREITTQLLALLPDNEANAVQRAQHNATLVNIEALAHKSKDCCRSGMSDKLP